jgi:pyruvate,water dikinase
MPLEQKAEAAPTRNEWQGRGVSAGIAIGKARIVNLPNELGRVESGEILVAPSTDPAWTPVFGRLAGLVMERGGVLSHGAVVAREYHLPAVTAIPNLTHELSDGELIEVDGTSGMVRRVR